MTVSIVATGVIQRGGIQHPLLALPASPACLAAPSAASKIRSGLCEPASRARLSTSTVRTNPG